MSPDCELATTGTPYGTETSKRVSSPPRLRRQSRASMPADDASKPNVVVVARGAHVHLLARPAVTMMSPLVAFTVTVPLLSNAIVVSMRDGVDPRRTRRALRARVARDERTRDGDEQRERPDQSCASH